MLFKVAKACLARALFAGHAFVAVWRIVDIKGQDEKYWLFATPLLLLLLEGLVSICHRGGDEHKWFCPSVFLYLCCSIPPLWVLELDWAGRRREKHVGGPCTNTSIRAERLSPLLGLDLDIKIELPPDLWPKVLEQFLLVNLIIGRWLLPKGELTRYQLSQLLLVYIGMAADIIEILEALKEEAVVENYELPYITLGLWSLSLLQFTTVLTATKGRKPRFGNDTREKGSWKAKGSPQKCCSVEKLCDLDMWAILTTIILQDGPFLGLRLTLIIRYNVVSYLNLFFTCKNSLMLLLQMYRLSVLCFEGEREKPTNGPTQPTDHVVHITMDPAPQDPKSNIEQVNHAANNNAPDALNASKPTDKLVNGVSPKDYKNNIILGFSEKNDHAQQCRSEHSKYHIHLHNHDQYSRSNKKTSAVHPNTVIGSYGRRSGNRRYPEEWEMRRQRQVPQEASHKSATLPKSYAKTKIAEKRRRAAEELYKTQSLLDGLQYQVLLYPKLRNRACDQQYSSTKF